MKRCYKCKEHKDPSKFSKDRSRKDGLQPQCKDCDRVKRREYDERHPEKKTEYNARYYSERREAVSEYNRLYRYGISAAEFNAMLAAQDDACAVCRTPADECSRMCVDHCHTSGKVRGLLCSNCNVALGMLNDDPALLQAAANYLTGSIG